MEEADELGHALETWSDATTQHLVKVGRMSQIPLTGTFATFRMKHVLDIHAAWTRHSGGYRQCRIEIMEISRPLGQHHSQSVTQISPSRTRILRCKKFVASIQGGDALSKKVMEDLSSAEHKSVVDESSSIVLSLFET